jgi:hypothetical protein
MQQPPMMPPMSPPMSPPMMPPAQGMAGGGVVRMREGEDVPYTGGTGASYIYRDSIFNPERFSRMMEMNFPNYSLVSSGFGFNPQENLLNRNENVPAQQARSPSIGSSELTDKLAEALTKEETQKFPYAGGTGLTEYGQNLFSQGLQEGQTVEEIVRNIYNYRPSTTATARGARRDQDQPSTEEYIKRYRDDFSTPGLIADVP